MHGSGTLANEKPVYQSRVLQQPMGRKDGMLIIYAAAGYVLQARQSYNSLL